MNKNYLYIIILFFIASTSIFGDVVPNGLFTDNIVLQRNMPVPVWGKAKPGEIVKVSFAGQNKEVKTDNNGKWLIKLDPLKTSKTPSKMEISGNNKIVLSNILVGEVWLCSGQSNMAMGVSGSFGGKEAVAKADKPMIRLFTVPRQAEPQPCEALKVKSNWLVCSPKTLRFSAAGYFFGRELHDRLGIPIGLIHSSVGGTTAQAWTPLKALKNAGFYNYVQQYSKDSEMSDKDFEKRREARKKLYKQMEIRAIDPGNQGEGKGWHKSEIDLSGWEKVSVPNGWFKNKTIYGSVWYRRKVNIPAEWAGKDLMLNLGTLVDYDTTYFNGTKIGSIGPETPNWWQTHRNYKIPGELVKAGKNCITIRIFNDFMTGGFTSDAEMLKLSRVDGTGKPIMLAGIWQRKIENAIKTFPYNSTKAITTRYNVPSFLYNGMIAPLVPYGIRGVIWYQGEFNAPWAYEYRFLFPTMIKAWRDIWQEGAFPFYFVQLPNFHPVAKVPAPNTWAEIRESQEQTLSKIFNTGMAVTIDIGEANNIHPRNKQDVGLRLALVALAKTYGKNVEFTGPICKSMQIEGSKIRLFFNPTGGGLVVKGQGPLRAFAICGADKQFVWADAKIEDNTIILSSPKVKNPIAVRYAWSSNPGANLYGKNGLPAKPFRTDSFHLTTQKK